MTTAEHWQLIGLWGIYALICLGGGVMFLVMTGRARRRHLRRLAALQGNADAMPLAEIHPDPTLVPDELAALVAARIGKPIRVRDGA